MKSTGTKLGSSIVSTLMVVTAAGIVVLGHESDASARNNSKQFHEECWNEGCDNEEREEMYDNGDFNEETREWSVNNAKPRFSATFEAAELAHPSSTTQFSWALCSTMCGEFWNILNKQTTNVTMVWTDCWTRSFNNNHRNH